MTLEGMRENGKAQLAQSVNALWFSVEWRGGIRAFGRLFLFPARHGIKRTEIRADIACARGEDYTDIAVGGLSAKSWTEDAEEVEIGEVIDLPFFVNAVDCERAGAWWFGGATC